MSRILTPTIAAPDADITTTSSEARAWLRGLRLFFGYLAIILLAAILITFGVEAVLRGSPGQAFAFLIDPSRPAPATVALIALTLIGVDALTRRPTQSVLIVAPVLLLLAWIGHEKRFYLGDPPYPTDFLYARQIVELMPLMVVERPMTGLLIALATIAGAALLFLLWRRSRFLPKTGLVGRVARLAIAIPPLFYFATHMDYASHSPLRSSMKISPKMWDQTANYQHNGLILAFSLNVPMANVAAPVGYSAQSMEAIAMDAGAAFVPARRPDIIMVMSESFWDPKRLPGVEITPDPIAFTRSIQSGHTFSPEFGGMTANAEFEALTGFSNAFLPYGSIPYQQYVRGEFPSLASFLKEEGYATLAIHPFQSWFWNRGNVYEAFGFDRFLSEENMEPLEKRGRLASDAALTDLLISEADASDDPIFAFAVSLQNHGPYEPGRYPDERIDVNSDGGEAARAAIHTFSEGMMDSDLAFKRLIEWAQKRKRETVIVFFGDHLPPLGQTYVSTGFMERTVSNRFGPPEELTRERETPLSVWSNRKGTIEDIGTISPAFLPLHVLRAADMKHPFYTGFLDAVHERWAVIDRHLAVGQDGSTREGWGRGALLDPLLRDYRLIQYDTMFGSRYGTERLFPPVDAPLVAGRNNRINW